MDKHSIEHFKSSDIYMTQILASSFGDGHKHKRLSVSYQSDELFYMLAVHGKDAVRFDCPAKAVDAYNAA